MTNPGFATTDLHLLHPSRGHARLAAFLTTVLFAVHAYAATGVWVDRGLESEVINALVVDPSASGTLYAGTDRGAFKTIDNGVNWTAASSGMDGMSIRSLAINPISPQILYAAAGRSVYKTTDGGSHWSNANWVGSSAGWTTCVNLDPSNPQTVYACTGTGLYRSTDAGASWVLCSPPPYLAYVFAIDPTSPSTLYIGQGSTLLKSTDGGSHWTTKYGLTSTISALLVDPLSPQTIYAGLNQGSWGGTYRSTDGGDTWRAVIDAYRVFALINDPNSPQQVYAATSQGVIDINGPGYLNDPGLPPYSPYALAFGQTGLQSLYAGCWTGVWQYSTATSPVVTLTVASNPAGIGVAFDRASFTDAQTISALVGSAHRVSANSELRENGIRNAFVNWSDGGAASHVIVTPAIDTTYVANFSTEYLLSIQTEGYGTVTMDPPPSAWDGLYFMAGTQVKLTAVPDPAYVFGSWSGDLSGSVNPQTITMSSPREVTVKFSPMTTTVTVATVPDGLAYNVDSQDYSHAQSFTWAVGSLHSMVVYEQPQDTPTRYVFGSWNTGGITDRPEASGISIYTPSTPTSYIATFRTEHKLATSVSSDAGGTISITPGSTDGYYTDGSSVQLSAVANSGYAFAGWSGSLVGMATPQTVTMSEPRTVRASFLPQGTQTVTITMNTNPIGAKFTVDGMTYSTAQTFFWSPGSSHSIAAVSPSDSGFTRYLFAGWSDGGALAHSIVVPAISTIYTANFTTRYFLLAAVDPQVGGQIVVEPSSTDGYYAGGTQVKVQAYPNSGFLFSHFSGSLTGATNPQYLTIAGPCDVTASFAQQGGASVNMVVSAAGAATTNTPGTNATLSSGYASLTITSGSAPYGTAVFSIRQDGVTISEAGVPASPPTTTARVFVDYRSNVNALPLSANAGPVNINTGIALVNYGSESASITYLLRDANGTSMAVGHGTLAAGHHFACFIDELKTVAAADFNLPVGFQLGSLEISSDKPVSVMAIRGTMNQRNDFLVTTTPSADLNRSVGSSPIYFPQFADGSGYTTSIILLNTSSQYETGTMQIRDTDGNPVTTTQAGGTSGASFSYSIPPGGLYRFQSDGTSSGLKTGWLSLTPTGGTATPVGSGVYSYSRDDILVSESGIPSATATTHARIYADLSGNHNTGVAIANLANAGAAITIRAYRDDGTTEVGTGQPLSLSANGYKAAFANQFIAGLPDGFMGVLDISSPQPFAALTVRSLVNERNDSLMTTFPVADMNQAAPSPVVFPQIADGAGYATQFIVISAGAAAAASLNYFDANGAALAFGN